MAIFKKPAIKAEGGKKKEIPRGLFQKCPGCSEVVPEIELAQNQRVCPRCDYHFAQSAKERIDNLLDPESFVEMDAGLKSVDTLRFQGMATYKDRLKNYQERTGLTDAVIIGYAGPRVIKETTHQDLPQKFQTAEFLQEHGLIDLIVHRKKMREQLSRLLSYFSVVP